MNNSAKNVWMFVWGCLFYQQIHSQHQLNLCYVEYSCEHSPWLEHAVGCFPLIWNVLLHTSKQKRCAYFRHLWLVKVKVTLQSFLLHLLRCFYFIVQFLIMVLTIIVSSSLNSNKLGNNSNCDANLLMPMSSLLI